MWIKNPAELDGKILAVSLWRGAPNEVVKLIAPGPENMNGSSIKIDYFKTTFPHMISVTTFDGESQPLIMWDQLTEQARQALNEYDSFRGPMPLSDKRFEQSLFEAWPFSSAYSPDKMIV